MAKQNSPTKNSVQDKCDYYGKRVNDRKLTVGQRRYAQKRLSELCGGKSGKSAQASKFTDAQKAAYTAGRVYGMAKSGKRVPVKKENQASFSKGVERERGKNKTRTLY